VGKGCCAILVGYDATADILNTTGQGREPELGGKTELKSTGMRATKQEGDRGGKFVGKRARGAVTETQASSIMAGSNR
jgi:hypothetical protein